MQQAQVISSEAVKTSAAKYQLHLKLAYDVDGHPTTAELSILRQRKVRNISSFEASPA